MICVDGSNQDGACMGAAAGIWRVDRCGIPISLHEPWHHAVAVPGYFVGAACCELAAVILGYRMYDEFLRRRGIIIQKLFTDSQRAYSYKDNDPESPEGEKLWPLIRLMRDEIRRHGELDLGLCRGKENPADRLAKSAVKVVGPSSGEPAGVWFDRCGFALSPVIEWGMGENLLEAIREVERMMLDVHPLRAP